MRLTDSPPTTYLDAEAKKKLGNRLSRIEGHIRSIKKMVDDERCADEILLQVAAVKAAINQFSANVLDHELKACVHGCMSGSENERLDKVLKVLSALLKQS